MIKINKMLSFICLIKLIYAFGYPEDNCYKCFADNYYGSDSMYFCRHNTTGLIWGQCCKKGSSTSASCNEMGE